MNHGIKKSLIKAISACLLAAFLLNTSGAVALAQSTTLLLPAPTQFIHLSPNYSHPVLKGLKFNPNSPLKVEFIIDTADKGEVSQEEASRLIKYFLAALTMPKEDIWVNLSPYEADTIAEEHLSQTDLGRDLLSQDFILKQLSSSLTYPESDTGKDFWKQTYKQVIQLAGTTNIPINTFNKVWIVPKSSEVYENKDTALITQARLDVLLEQDYLSLHKNISSIKNHQSKPKDKLIQDINQASSNIMKQLILPKIKRDVNFGKNFANLRQIYHSLILGFWFKGKFKDTIYKHYINQAKIKGINLPGDTDSKDKIYQHYLKAFKTGLYDYIKADYDPKSQKNIRRRYFSGGSSFARLPTTTRTRYQLPPGVNDADQLLIGPATRVVAQAEAAGTERRSEQYALASSGGNDSVAATQAKLISKQRLLKSKEEGRDRLQSVAETLGDDPNFKAALAKAEAAIEQLSKEIAQLSGSSSTAAELRRQLRDSLWGGLGGKSKPYPFITTKKKLIGTKQNVELLVIDARQYTRQKGISLRDLLLALFNIEEHRFDSEIRIFQGQYADDALAAIYTHQRSESLAVAAMEITFNYPSEGEKTERLVIAAKKGDKGASSSGATPEVLVELFRGVRNVSVVKLDHLVFSQGSWVDESNVDDSESLRVPIVRVTPKIKGKPFFEILQRIDKAPETLGAKKFKAANYIFSQGESLRKCCKLYNEEAPNYVAVVDFKLKKGRELWMVQASSSTVADDWKEYNTDGDGAWGETDAARNGEALSWQLQQMERPDYKYTATWEDPRAVFLRREIRRLYGDKPLFSAMSALESRFSEQDLSGVSGESVIRAMLEAGVLEPTEQTYRQQLMEILRTGGRVQTEDKSIRVRTRHFSPRSFFRTIAKNTDIRFWSRRDDGRFRVGNFVFTHFSKGTDPAAKSEAIATLDLAISAGKTERFLVEIEKKRGFASSAIAEVTVTTIGQLDAHLEQQARRGRVRFTKEDDYVGMPVRRIEIAGEYSEKTFIAKLFPGAKGPIENGEVVEYSHTPTGLTIERSKKPQQDMFAEQEVVLGKFADVLDNNAIGAIFATGSRDGQQALWLVYKDGIASRRPVAGSPLTPSELKDVIKERSNSEVSVPYSVALGYTPLPKSKGSSKYRRSLALRVDLLPFDLDKFNDLREAKPQTELNRKKTLSRRLLAMIFGSNPASDGKQDNQLYFDYPQFGIRVIISGKATRQERHDQIRELYEQYSDQDLSEQDFWSNLPLVLNLNASANPYPGPDLGEVISAMKENRRPKVEQAKPYRQERFLVVSASSSIAISPQEAADELEFEATGRQQAEVSEVDGVPLISFDIRFPQGLSELERLFPDYRKGGGFFRIRTERKNALLFSPIEGGRQKTAVDIFKGLLAKDDEEKPLVALFRVRWPDSDGFNYWVLQQLMPGAAAFRLGRRPQTSSPVSTISKVNTGGIDLQHLETSTASGSQAVDSGYFSQAASSIFNADLEGITFQIISIDRIEDLDQVLDIPIKKKDLSQRF